jgi:hypothetical protein
MNREWSRKQTKMNGIAFAIQWIEKEEEEEEEEERNKVVAKPSRNAMGEIRIL